MGLDAPVIMVTGNHEGFDWIDWLLADLPESPPPSPVEPSQLPSVDGHGRIRLLPSGWRVRTPAGRVVGGIGGIQPGQRLASGYPEAAYIKKESVEALRSTGALDVLISHQGPARVQSSHSGAELLDVLADQLQPRAWFHGHSRQRTDPVRIGRGWVYPLGDATFSDDGRVRREGWATVTGTGQQLSVTCSPPRRLAELHRRHWATIPNATPVAPHLARLLDRGTPSFG